MGKLPIEQQVGNTLPGGFIARWRRWMYRSRRPNWLARMLIQVDVAAAALGLTGNYEVLLEVPGRKSGRVTSLPLVVAIVDGEQYLVSMLGNDAQWVRNVQAARGHAVLRSGKRRAVVLEEVPTSERAPILKAYLGRAPGARPHIPVDKNAPLAAFETIAAAFPVFRVVTRKE